MAEMTPRTGELWVDESGRLVQIISPVSTFIGVYAKIISDSGHNQMDYITESTEIFLQTFTRRDLIEEQIPKVIAGQQWVGKKMDQIRDNNLTVLSLFNGVVTFQGMYGYGALSESRFMELYDLKPYSLPDDIAKIQFENAQETMNEVVRINQKWGSYRTMPDVQSDRHFQCFISEKEAKGIVDYHKDHNTLSWQDILTEEVAEVYESDPGSDDMVAELIQAAAVCWSWIEDIKRRNS